MDKGEGRQPGSVAESGPEAALRVFGVVNAGEGQHKPVLLDEAGPGGRQGEAVCAGPGIGHVISEASGGERPLDKEVIAGNFICLRGVPDDVIAHAGVGLVQRP